MTSNVFMITCAYEQGVGKGHQAFSRNSEVNNPYLDSVCNEAWALGYKEGKRQAERLKQVEPVAIVGSDFQLLFTRLNWSEGLKVGDKLYTHPQQGD